MKKSHKIVIVVVIILTILLNYYNSLWKKFILLLVLTSFVSCGSLKSTNPNADKWIQRTLPPSQVNTIGAIFYKENLKGDGYNTPFESFSVGGYIGEDETYWYNILMQDLGWRKNIEGGWTSVGSDYTQIKRGYLYINLKKRVAIYIHPENTFNGFRVALNPKSEN